MISDSDLRTFVLSELKWWPGVNAIHVAVAVKAGIVTLSGTVVHYAEKAAAERAAKAIYGVKAVKNELDVEPTGSTKRGDQAITEAALNALEWDFEVPQDKVKVSVAKGWITLDGAVARQYQRDAAARCVRNLMGVVGITNRISIKPVAKPLDVKRRILGAFHRNAALDARRIGVVTDEGVVTLTGGVSSWAERDEAIAAAWAAPGVRAVKDNLVIQL